MTFRSVERVSDLPPAAWLFSLAGGEASLTCGESVTVWDDGFFEGAWAGPFDDGGFSLSPDVFGSGAHETSAGWLLVPPSHTLECIFVLRAGGSSWFASNSLAFLFATTGARFRLPSRRLAGIFIRIIEGVRESPISVETTAGTFLAIHHHNCLLTPVGFQLQPKPNDPAFQDYTAYVTHLRDTLAAVADNATASGRRHPYRLLATISTGYDSPACAAIAAQAGCEEAISFASARGGAPDAGTAVAQHLDLSVHVLDRPETTRELGEVELEFLATGTQGEDAVYAAASDRIAGRALVTGFHGGRLWDRWGRAGEVLDSNDASGTSLAEFRLARDFIHVPLPFVGARRHDEIVRISNSVEMQPFCLDNTYDRPIPRRIVEEAGAPRHAFGQTKKAVSLLGFLENELFSEDLRRAVKAQIDQFTVLERFLYGMHSGWFSAAMRCHAALPRGQNALPARLRAPYRRALDRTLLAIFGRPFKVLEHSDPVMGLAFDHALTQVSKRYMLGVGLDAERPPEDVVRAGSG